MKDPHLTKKTALMHIVLTKASEDLTRGMIPESFIEDARQLMVKYQSSGGSGVLEMAALILCDGILRDDVRGALCSLAESTAKDVAEPPKEKENV